MPDKKIQIYLTKKNELAFKFVSDTSDNTTACFGFMDLDLVAGNYYGGNQQDRLFVDCTPNDNNTTFKIKFKSKDQRDRFQYFLTQLGIQQHIQKNDSEECSLEISTALFSDGNVEQKNKEVTLTDALYQELLLRKVFDKLKQQEIDPNNSDHVLKVEELQQAIAENNIQANCKHYDPSSAISLLAAAVKANNYEVVDYLLSISEVDVNQQSVTQDTALHHAAAGSEELVLKLIAKGARLTITNNNGQTPLDLASSTLGLQDKMIGKLIDRILALQENIETIPNPIKIDGDNITFSLPEGCEFLSQLQAYMQNMHHNVSSWSPPITLKISDLQEFLIKNKYILDTNAPCISVSGVALSLYNRASSDSQNIQTITQHMSYTEWLTKKYGVICCGERGEKNTNKSTSILYSFTTKDQREAFCKDLSPDKSLIHHYKTDFQYKPAVVLADQPPNVSNNDRLYEKYQREMSAVLNNDLQTYSIQQATALLKQKQQDVQSIQDTQGTIAKYDNIQKAHLPLSRHVLEQSGSRLDEFKKVAAETQEGMHFYKSVASYKLSLEAFIAANIDMLSKAQKTALKLASTALMGDGEEAVKTGLKADSNFVDFLWNNRDKLVESKTYNPNSLLTTILQQDAQDLLEGREKRLVINDQISAAYVSALGGKQLITGTSPPTKDESFRTIPRFLPPDDTTDEIILQTGGSASHSTMVRIWKIAQQVDGKTYYRFFRTEYNTGAGCHIPRHNTCQGTYTSEISGEYFNKKGETIKQLPTVEQYNQKMRERLAKLICAERTILMYKAPTAGPNGEQATQNEHEKQRWEKERKKIREAGLISYYDTQQKKLVNQECYREQYSSKAIVQFSGNCTIKSQKQLVEDILRRKGDLSPAEAQTLAQLHFGWAQKHGKQETTEKLAAKQQQLEIEIQQLQKVIADKQKAEEEAKAAQKKTDEQEAQIKKAKEKEQEQKAKQEATDKQTAALIDLHTKFNTHIKFIADRTYLRPMKSTENSTDKTNVTGMEFTDLLTEPTVTPLPDQTKLVRGIHGLRHATRVTNYIDILHKFRSEQTLTKDGTRDKSPEDNIAGVAKFFSITSEDVLMLTKFAAFFHDSARETEGKDFWEHRSAENCYNFLVKQGINEKAARFFANAARFKGHGTQFNDYLKTLGIPEDQQNVLYNNFHYVRNLINAADTLDIMRCTNKFEAYRLDNFFKVQEHAQNKEKSRQLIRNIHGVIVAEGDGHEIQCIFREAPHSETLLNTNTGDQWTIADQLNVEHNLDPYDVMKKHMDQCMLTDIPAPNNVVAVNPGTPQQTTTELEALEQNSRTKIQQELATSMADLEKQFNTELQKTKAKEQAATLSTNLSHQQSLGAEPDATTYLTKCSEYFSQNPKMAYTASDTPPSKDNDYKIGEITGNQTQEVVAIIKYGSIEGKKTDTISDLTEDHYEAFITFLKMESLVRDPPVTIKINHFSPSELTGFLNTLKQESGLTNIVLELSASAATCIYGANKPYTDEQYATAQQLVQKYNTQTQNQELHHNPPSSTAYKH